MYVCPVCGKKYESQHWFERHVDSHTDENEYEEVAPDILESKSVSGGEEEILVETSNEDTLLEDEIGESDLVEEPEIVIDSEPEVRTITVLTTLPDHMILKITNDGVSSWSPDTHKVMAFWVRGGSMISGSPRVRARIPMVRQPGESLTCRIPYPPMAACCAPPSMVRVCVVLDGVGFVGSYADVDVPRR